MFCSFLLQLPAQVSREILEEAKSIRMLTIAYD